MLDRGWFKVIVVFHFYLVMFPWLPRYPEAMVYLSLLREHHPLHINGLSQLATCHMQMGERQQAKEMFTEVLKRDPNHNMALQNYGELL